MENHEVETAKGQRDQFAYYIVRIAVALGMVDGKELYTGEQVAFLAETAIKTISATNEHENVQYAVERNALLNAMPPLPSI